jgi:anaphase-promoting complex subunit 6
VELDLKHELFYLAHKLVEDHPKLAIAWYAVGCYYYSIKNYASSRRFLSKSTVIDRDFGPAWLAFGHAFAAEGENDQALAAYRTAARLMPGSHIPPTAIAMELIRANNFALALVRIPHQDATKTLTFAYLL